MFSFDVSAVDLVLLVAVAVLFSLYLTKKPHASTTAEAGQTLQENPKITSKALKSKKNARKSQTRSQECIHDFGYLGSLPKGTPIPGECFGCAKVIQCLHQTSNSEILDSGTPAQFCETEVADLKP